MMAAAVAPARNREWRFPFLKELAVVVAAYFAYFAVRGATEGDVALAIEHAKLVEGFERGLGIFIEAELQAAILGQSWLVDFANWVYVWGHWPVIIGVGAWLYRSRPERYRLVRNALLISGAIGLVIFASFPVAPPRLAEMGLVDTVLERSTFYRVLQPPQLTNQYAALPSLHFGWNLLIGIAIFHESSRLSGKVLGVALPLAMLVAVVLTANHYLVDTVAGGTLALIGLGAAYLVQNRSAVAAALTNKREASKALRSDHTPRRQSPWGRSILVRSKLYATTVLVFATMFLISCGEEGSGDLVTESRFVGEFTAVDVAGALEAEIAIGAPLAVEVRFDDNLLDNLQTDVRGRTLYIWCDPQCDPSSDAVARIIMPSLSSITASGASRVTAGELSNERLSLDASGASRIEVRGSTEELEVVATGASQIDADDLTTNLLDIDLSGASAAEVGVRDEASGGLSGASKLTVSGDPDIDIDTSGSSSVVGGQAPASSN